MAVRNLQRLTRALHRGLQLGLGLTLFVAGFVALVPAELTKKGTGDLAGIKLRITGKAVATAAGNASALRGSATAVRPKPAVPAVDGGVTAAVSAASAPAPAASLADANTPGSTSASAVAAAPPASGKAAAEPNPQTIAALDSAGAIGRPLTLPRPVAIDSATVVSGVSRVRIAGVSPIDPSRQCRRDGASWHCGAQARTAFRNWLRSRSIRCAVPADFFQKRQDVEADCTLGTDDIGEWLVRNGWAEAKDASRYAVLQDEAKKVGAGIWGDGR